MLHLEVITPEEILVSVDVDKVFLPGTMGAFEVLKGHAPLISSLESGKISYAGPAGADVIEIRSGFVEVRNNKVTVCAEK